MSMTSTGTETTNWQLVIVIYFSGIYMSPGDYLEDYLPGLTLCLKIALVQCQLISELLQILRQNPSCFCSCC